jgi:Plasmid pRiA4b ORF-3-like protein
MADPTVSSIAIYQLRVLLCGVSPLVWRRLLVISETSLAELREILQTAFDWSGEHLHRFLIHGAAYGAARRLRRDLGLPQAAGLAQKPPGSGGVEPHGPSRVPVSRFRW